MSRTPARFTQADVAREISAYKRILARKNASKATFVYFIRAGEFVKIGHSRSWRIRLKQMQIGSPYTLVPLLVLSGTPAMERKLHLRFRSDHFRGEWFHNGPAISSFIRSNLSNCVAKEPESVMEPEIEEEVCL